eukprot:Em0006g323a
MLSGKNRGFAFLEFKNEDDYESALAQNGNTLNGRKITVSEFKERAKKKDKFQETSIVKLDEQTELKAFQEADPSFKAAREGAEHGNRAEIRESNCTRTACVTIRMSKHGDRVGIQHSIPLAGHLGKHKTADRLLQRFYWPTLRKDAADFCRRCAICQKASPVKPRRAPLIPLPIVDEPFQKVAMDIVGPLPRSGSGNKYVLVVCDYATRYPEAVPMKSVDAESVAEELGREVRGPLDVIKETWVAKSNSNNSVISHILAMRDKMDLMTKVVHDSLEEAQMKQKTCEWEALLVLVKKKDGSLRLCVDFRRLNSVSESDAYPMPRIDDLIDLLGKAKYISTLDLTRGYCMAAPIQVQWTGECDRAFNKLKQQLCSAPVLSSPDYTRPFVLQTDASECGVGAVLSQRSDQGKDHPIAYFSKKLLPRA